MHSTPPKKTSSPRGRTLPVVTLALASYSKSPGDVLNSATTAATRQLFGNLVEKDASHQTEGLIGMLLPNAEWEPFKAEGPG
jgi:hypothetical protein